MYSGIFYKRYILGLWVVAEGIIYSMFDKEKHVVKASDYQYKEYYVSCDYGTQNLLHLVYGGKHWIISTL